jgi:hypothetical protein
MLKDRSLAISAEILPGKIEMIFCCAASPVNKQVALNLLFYTDVSPG